MAHRVCPVAPVGYQNAPAGLASLRAGSSAGAASAGKISGVLPFWLE
ncbi:MAG: hypothetical protein ABIA59_03090 [Candidatus Latescibacterota bacterium]